MNELMNDWLKPLGGASSLATSLIGLIVLALLVVLVFNLLQGRQRRAREAARLREEAATQTPSDSSPAETPQVPTTASPRQEPVWTDPPAADPPAAPKRSDAAPATTILAAQAARAAHEPAFRVADPAVTAPPAPDVTPAPVPDPATPTGSPSGSAESVSVTASDALAPAPTPGAGLPQTLAAVPSERLDPRLDCIVSMELQSPREAALLVEAAAALRSAGGKPILVEADGGAAGWLGLQAGLPPQQRLRVGLLLANRGGPLEDQAFDEFERKVSAFAQAVGAVHTRMPDREPVLEHARQVDGFYAQLDTLIGINLRTAEPVSPPVLAELAQSLGLVPQKGQRYASLDDEGAVRFTLSAGEKPDLVTFLLDVPRAAAAGRPWMVMLETARRAALALDGSLVDDALRPLTDASVAAVSRQLESHYQALEAAGLPAGSPAALRVFS